MCEVLQNVISLQNWLSRWLWLQSRWVGHLRHRFDMAPFAAEKSKCGNYALKQHKWWNSLHRRVGSNVYVHWLTIFDGPGYTWCSFIDMWRWLSLTCVCVCVSCLFSLDECRNIILQYGVREVTASQVARVLGMMARTHSGLTDGIPLQVTCLVNGQDLASKNIRYLDYISLVNSMWTKETTICFSILVIVNYRHSSFLLTHTLWYF